MKRHAVRHGAEIAARGRSRVCGRGGVKGILKSLCLSHKAHKPQMYERGNEAAKELTGTSTHPLQWRPLAGTFLTDAQQHLVASRYSGCLTHQSRQSMLSSSKASKLC